MTLACGKVRHDPVLAAIAERHGATPAGMQGIALLGRGGREVNPDTLAPAWDGWRA